MRIGRQVLGILVLLLQAFVIAFSFTENNHVWLVRAGAVSSIILGIAMILLPFEEGEK